MLSFSLDRTGETTLLRLRSFKVSEDLVCGLETEFSSLNLSRIFPLEFESEFLWKSFWLIKKPDKKATEDRDKTVNAIKSF